MGRCTVTLPMGERLLHRHMPDGVELIDNINDPLRGVAFAILEGEGLPRWEPGTAPQSFSSLDAVRDYLKSKAA